MNANPQPNAPQQLARIPAAAFAAKFQSKREVYRFLSSEVKAYLPSYETVTVWHLRDLAMGVKRIIYSDKVKLIQIPQFDGLTIQTIFDFARGDQDVESALPPSNEIKKLSRAYLANVIYTIMGQNFQNWVDAQVKIRNEKIALEGNNVIAMDPKIAAIFNQSTAISVSKGRSSYLMKPNAQRRKTKFELQEQKIQAQRLDAEVAEKIRRFEEMEQQAADAQQNLHNLGNMKAQIDSMFEQGYIFKQEDGSLGLSQSEDQRKFMAESNSKVRPQRDNLNFMNGQPQPGGGVNLDDQFQDAAGNGDKDEEY